MTNSDASERRARGDAGEEGDERHVVTVFLRSDGELLLLERSDAVGTYAGRWGAVAGYAEDDPDAAAHREIAEETGLADAVTLVRRGDTVAFTDADLGVSWVVHPYLFDCDSRAVTPNEEASATAWCPATDILRRETVPRLWEAYSHVRPRVETIQADTTHGSAWLSVRALEVLRDEAGVRAERDEEQTARTLVETADALLATRPSMTALTNRVNRVMSDARADDWAPSAVERAASEGIARAIDADEDAAATAAARLAGETVLTLSRSGTVERALTTDPGPSHVYVAESRPACEGVGVAERLSAHGIPVTLLTDAAIAHVLATGDVDRIVVGADTVLPDGSVVNKTGTRGAAIAATIEGVPVEVVTAADKVSTENRAIGERGPDTELYDGDAALAVENPTFDHTPARFVDCLATERGPVAPDEVAEISREFRALAAWRNGEESA